MTEMSAHPEMACRELVEALTDYLEGRLPPRDAARLEEHLEDCVYCAEYLRQMRQTIASLGQVSQESLAAEKREQLLAAFRGWQRR